MKVLNNFVITKEAVKAAWKNNFTTVDKIFY